MYKENGLCLLGGQTFDLNQDRYLCRPNLRTLAQAVTFAKTNKFPLKQDTKLSQLTQ
jgi:hypothetical protein